MGRRDREREAAREAAQQQASALGMSQEELEAAMAGVHFDKNTRYYVEPDDASPREVDFKKLVTIWPNYIDANKTLQQGRRIPKEAACPAPTAEDMSEVLKELGLRHTFEPWRQYPRDFLCPGRVKVELFHPITNISIHPDCPTRRALMLKVAERIPHLKSRQERLEAEAAAKKAQEAAVKGTPVAGPNKKKGKKGKQKGK